MTKADVFKPRAPAAPDLRPHHNGCKAETRTSSILALLLSVPAVTLSTLQKTLNTPSSHSRTGSGLGLVKTATAWRTEDTKAAPRVARSELAAPAWGCDQ